MKKILTDLAGVVIIKPDAFQDYRGYFFESFNSIRYKSLGIIEDFVQDNISVSIRNTLRGMHFQNPNMQGKLVSVLNGEALDVIMDIRVGSPTFSKWTSVLLNNKNKYQVYIPPGFAHGFLALEDNTIFHYKCTEFYNAAAEKSILWNDPNLHIEWPCLAPLLSSKDSGASLLSDMSEDELPKFLTIIK